MSDANSQSKVPRRYPRVELAARIQYTSEHLSIIEEIRDISLGGVFLNTAFLDPIGTKAALHIILPEHPEVLVCSAVVRWTTLDRKGTGDPTNAGMGIEFTEDLATLRDELIRRLGRDILPENVVLLSNNASDHDH